MIDLDSILADVPEWQAVNRETERVLAAQRAHQGRMVADEAAYRQAERDWQIAYDEAHAAGRPTPPAPEPTGSPDDPDRSRAYVAEISRLADQRRAVLADHARLVEQAARVEEDTDLRDGKLSRAASLIADAAARATRRHAAVLQARSAADRQAGLLGANGTAARTTIRVTPADILVAVANSSSLLTPAPVPARPSGEIVPASRYRPAGGQQVIGLTPPRPFGTPPSGVTPAPLRY